MKKRYYPGLFLFLTLALAIALAGCGGGGGNKNGAGTPAVIYVSTKDGLAISKDGGSTFTYKTVANGLASNETRDVYVTDSMFFVTTREGLSVSTDAGESFTTPVVVYDMTDIYVSDDNTIYVGSLNNGIYISKDGGKTFSNSNYENGVDRASQIYASGSTVYATSMPGLSISENGGESFKKLIEFEESNSYCTIVLNSRIYVGTDDGLWVSTDNGATFELEQNLPAAWIFVIQKSDNNLYFGVRSNTESEKGFWVSKDNGKTFEKIGSFSPNDIFVSGSFIYASSYDGLFISNDGGKSFTQKKLYNISLHGGVFVKN